eukprot:1142311-Pelagomonas_calceolata.AAC.1
MAAMPFIRGSPGPLPSYFALTRCMHAERCTNLEYYSCRCQGAAGGCKQGHVAGQGPGQVQRGFRPNQHLKEESLRRAAMLIYLGAGFAHRHHQLSASMAPRQTVWFDLLNGTLCACKGCERLSAPIEGSLISTDGFRGLDACLVILADACTYNLYRLLQDALEISPLKSVANSSLALPRMRLMCSEEANTYFAACDVSAHQCFLFGAILSRSP